MRRGLVLLVLAIPLSAQPGGFRKHYLTVGGGAGVPGGEVEPLLTASPLFSFGYGYRFNRFFQVDAGFDTVLHAAGIRDFYGSSFGDLRIRDYLHILPAGGRAIVPLARNRVLVSAGGGGAYMRYQERIQQPFSNGIRVACPVCRGRGGFGYYGLLGASFALDRFQNFRLGFSTRVYRAATDGDAFGPLPAFPTRDTWINNTIEFTFSF
jgi:hypothetical protein